jgi:hypothetical protein
MNDRSADAALFDLALYLVCCARLVVDENLGLASFRLAEGASRLIAAAEELGVPADSFLATEREAIDTAKLRVMHDLPGYVAAFDEIQARFVTEARRRNTGSARGERSRAS